MVGVLEGPGSPPSSPPDTLAPPHSDRPYTPQFIKSVLQGRRPGLDRLPCPSISHSRRLAETLGQ